MGEMSARCTKCDRAVNVVVDQAIWPGDRLMWSRTITCGACGSATEEDSAGIPPACVRQLLLERHGIWHLLLVNPSDRLSAVVLLRKIFELDLNAAAVLLQSSSELWLGTQVECRWLAKHMQRRDIVTTVQRA